MESWLMPFKVVAQPDIFGYLHLILKFKQERVGPKGLAYFQMEGNLQRKVTVRFQCLHISLDLSFCYSNIKPFNPLGECGSTERSNVDFFPGQEFLSSSEYLLVIKNILMVSFVLFSFFAQALCDRHHTQMRTQYVFRKLKAKML